MEQCDAVRCTLLNGMQIVQFIGFDFHTKTAFQFKFYQLFVSHKSMNTFNSFDKFRPNCTHKKREGLENPHKRHTFYGQRLFMH